MRKILCKSHQRHLLILEILLETNDYISIASLSKLLGASKRTISDDISQLNTKYSDLLSLTISKKNGIKLVSQSVSNIEAVFRSIFSESIALQWIKELLIHPYESIEFYEKALYVSKSTLLRTLPKINSFLKGYGMMIEIIEGKCNFYGDNETFLRDFSSSFLLELYGLNFEKLDIFLDLSPIANIIFKNLKNATSPENFDWVSKDDIIIVYRIMFYVVSLLRENHGYHIHSSYNVANEVSCDEFSIIRNSFNNITKDNLAPIHEYLYNRQNDSRKSSYLSNVIDEYINNYVIRVCSIFDIELDTVNQSKFNYVVYSMYLNSKLRPYETSLLFNRIHYFIVKLKKNNPFLFDIIYTETLQLSENLGVDLTKQVDNIIFWFVLIDPRFSKVSSTKKALLFSDFGSMHSSFLQKSLEAFFDTTCSKLSVTVANPMKTYSREDLEEYFIVLSTSSFVKIEHDRICYIGDFLDLDTYANILNVLNSTQQ